MPRNNFEKEVLGSVMLDAGAIFEIRDVLRPDDFTEPRHALLYRAMLALADKAAPIDPVTLLAKLGETNAVASAGGVEYISDLPALTPSASSIGYYAEGVAEAARLRRVKAIGVGLAAAPDSAEGAAVADEAMAALYDAVLVGQSRTTVATSAEVWLEAWTEMEAVRAAGTGVCGITSGFPAVDEITSGWVNGDLIYLAARPGVGKSTMGLQFARAATHAGKSVVYLSMEMRPVDLMYRLAASIGHVDEKRLRTGRLDAQQLDKLLRHIRQIENPLLTWDRPVNQTIEGLRAKVRIWKRQGICDLLIVDQLSTFVPDHHSRATTDVERVGGFSRGLKALAFEFDIPVLCQHQINRQGDDLEKPPRLEHMKDTGKTEEDAAMVLLMHRKWDNMKYQEGPVDLIVAKTRRGASGVVTLNFHALESRFATPDGGSSYA